jgi:hypothetical protein
MHQHRFFRTCLALAAATGLVVALSGSVATAETAAPDAGLSFVKWKSHVAITERVRALFVAGAIAKNSPYMGDHAQQRIDAMAQVGRDLWALNLKIQSDITTAEALADASRIATDFRVYVLVLPVTHLTRAADLVTNKLVPAHEKVAANLQDAITTKDRSDLQPLVDDMNASIEAANDAAAPLPDQLASFTAADWNANHELLTPARRALETARAELKAARDDARAIVAELKE